MDVNRALRSAAATGTVNLGFKETLKAVEGKKAKLVIVASNAPQTAVEAITAAAKKSNVPVYSYQGKNTELGPACGKPYSVAVLSVLEAGDSDVLQLAK
ncbi:MAG: 50S ribosomal protein L30e [Candidatus Thermoplasmatota archaeon]